MADERKGAITKVKAPGQIDEVLQIDDVWVRAFGQKDDFGVTVTVVLLKGESCESDGTVGRIEGDDYTVTYKFKNRAVRPGVDQERVLQLVADRLAIRG